MSVRYPFGGTIATIIEYVAGSKISEVNLLAFHQDISWFDVFVADVLRVNISQSVSKTRHPLPNQILLLICGAGLISQIRLQVTVGQGVYDDAELPCLLIRQQYLDNVRVTQSLRDLDLFLNVLLQSVLLPNLTRVVNRLASIERFINLNSINRCR